MIETRRTGSAPGWRRPSSAWPASWYAIRSRSMELSESLRSDPSSTFSSALLKSICATTEASRRAAARAALGDRPVMSIYVGDDVARNVILEVPRRNGTGVHRPVVHGLRIGQHHDHFLRD